MKVKIISILTILIVSVIAGCLTFYLASRGILDLKIMGITTFDWFYVILDVFVLGVTVYDYAEVRINKKKYGDLKFYLKRTNKRTSVIIFIFQVCLFILYTSFNLIIIKDMDFKIVSMMFLIAMAPIMSIYHIIAKDGLAEKCVYFWGNAIEWKNINSYDVNDNILTLSKTNKVFSMKENINMPFQIDLAHKDEILKFVEEKVKYISCDKDFIT